MPEVTVIVPSLLCKYASKTVEDLFAKAKGEIEVIVILDNYWPDPPLKDHPNLVVIKKGEQIGMRKAINDAVKIAKGEYIMKTDDHCMFGEGFDEILARDTAYNEVAIPERYSFEPETWSRGSIGPHHYWFMTFPYYEDNLHGMGLHGKKWLGIENNGGHTSFYMLERQRRHIPIDGILATQGSCWFAHKKRFLELLGLDEKYSYLIHQEPQEIAFKFWLTGGRMVINKNTHYCHWHKKNADRIWRRYRREWEIFTERFGTWYWMNDQFPLATRSMEWLVEQFWPIPGWPENWKEEKLKYESEHPEFNGMLHVFDENGNVGLPIKGVDTWPSLTQ